MAPKRGKSSDKTFMSIPSSEVDPDRFPVAGRRSTVTLDEDRLEEEGMGDEVFGDFPGNEEGPVLLQTSDDDEVERFGSREETNAALEGKIALQNTRRLHGRY